MGDLVGWEWTHYRRVLHPAEVAVAEGRFRTVSWAELAASRGRRVDLRVASWFDVGGVRPHQDVLPAGVDVEPFEGEYAGDLVARLVERLAPEPVPLRVGEWEGAGFDRDDTPETAFATIGGTRYRVLELPSDEAAARFRSTDAHGWPALAPNLVEHAGRWRIVADVDLMSTYIGAAEPLPDLDGLGLENVSVDPDMPVS